MDEKKEFEIVTHTVMNYLELFVVEMTSRCPHGHDDLEIGILLKGALCLFMDGKEYKLREGDIYIINRFQIHSFSSAGEKNLVLAFQVHSDFYRRICYQLNFLHFDNPVMQTGKLYEQTRDMLVCCASFYFSALPFREVKCAGLMLEALYLILSGADCSFRNEKEYMSAQNNTLRLNRITGYIAEHYKEKLSLNEIARLENITVCHASHFIRKMLGISFQEYLNNIRFDRALGYVRDSDLSILDICMETGFSSSRYLNRMFIEKFGMTVKEYRKAGNRPEPSRPVLPAENIQKRYDFEMSSFLLGQCKQKFIRY